MNILLLSCWFGEAVLFGGLETCCLCRYAKQKKQNDNKHIVRCQNATSIYHHKERDMIFSCFVVSSLTEWDWLLSSVQSASVRSECQVILVTINPSGHNGGPNARKWPLIKQVYPHELPRVTMSSPFDFVHGFHYASKSLSCLGFSILV